LNKTNSTKSVDLVEAAKEIVEAAKEIAIPMRILGAIATKLHCSKDATDKIRREVSDIDLMTYGRFRQQAKRLLLDFGCMLNERVAALYGKQRYIFYDENRNMVDVFFDKLQMCHTLKFTGRLELDYPTITLADLVLTKLQIVKLEEKDVKDLFLIFREHEVGTVEDETINAKYIAEVLARDWGYYYTFTSNLEKVKNAVKGFDTNAGYEKIITERIGKIFEYVEAEPKSLAWRLRAKIGTKKKWYVEIEYRKKL
jgi:hypothetical protein